MIVPDHLNANLFSHAPISTLEGLFDPILIIYFNEKPVKISEQLSTALNATVLLFLLYNKLCTFLSICQKDSHEINQTDREALVKYIINSAHTRIIVTHGTDTIIDTALFVQNRLSKILATTNKKVIFVGSFIPEKFKDSDADINIGAALGALDILDISLGDTLDKRDGSRCVYISLGGRVIPADKTVRNSVTGLFCHCDEIDVSGE